MKPNRSIITSFLALIVLCTSAGAQTVGEFVYDVRADINATNQLRSQTSQWIQSLDNAVQQYEFIRGIFKKQEDESLLRESTKAIFYDYYVVNSWGSEVLNNCSHTLTAISYFTNESTWATLSDGVFTPSDINRIGQVVNYSTREVLRIVNEVKLILPNAKKALSFQESEALLKRLKEESAKTKEETQAFLDSLNIVQANYEIQKKHMEVVAAQRRYQESLRPTFGAIKKPKAPTLLFCGDILLLPGLLFVQTDLDEIDITTINSYTNEMALERKRTMEEGVGGLIELKDVFQSTIYAALGITFLILLVSVFKTYLKNEQRHWDVWLKYVAAMLVVLVLNSLIWDVFFI